MLHCISFIDYLVAFIGICTRFRRGCGRVYNLFRCSVACRAVRILPVPIWTLRRIGQTVQCVIRVRCLPALSVHQLLDRQLVPVGIVCIAVAVLELRSLVILQADQLVVSVVRVFLLHPVFILTFFKCFVNNE